MPVSGVCQRAEEVYEAVDHIYRGATSFKRPSITLGHDNPFTRPSCGGRGSSGIWEGKEQQVLESPSLGFFSNPPLLGCGKHLIIFAITASTPPTPGRQTGALNIFTQVSTPLGSPVEPKPMCSPGFADIARSSWGDDAHTTIDLPTMLATSPGLLAGTAMATMMLMWLYQDSMMGATYIDMVTASMSLVSLGPTPMALDCPTATLEDVREQEPED